MSYERISSQHIKANADKYNKTQSGKLIITKKIFKYKFGITVIRIYIFILDIVFAY